VVAVETVASVLREAHPDVEPFEVEWPTLAEWVAAVGVNPDDDALVAATLVAWERLLV
jgi:hypothetical protein